MVTTATSAPPATRALKNANLHVMGAASCASSGCHGKAFDGQTRNWKTAYSIWTTEDPHRRAFEILYTERSVQIYRSFHPDARSEESALDHLEYSRFLEQRCVGCHATGAPGQAVVAQAGQPGEHDRFQSGVACESCHGAASGWIDEHYLAAWPTADTPAQTGFRDTADLFTRAAVCVGCHAGPMVADDGTQYDMNHDLIAAGHPRLTFELDAYLANYPKHWDEAKDQRRSGEAFHVNAWTLGQEQLARQVAVQIATRSQAAAAPWPEFAGFECYDCHHAIRPPDFSRQRMAGPEGRGLPRPALLPLAQLLAISQSRGDPAATAQLHAALDRGTSILAQSLVKNREELSPLVAALSSKDGAPLLPPCRREDLPRHAAGLRHLLADCLPGDGRRPTWDQAVQLYLAVQALTRDLDQEQRQPLATASAALAAALGPQNFSGQPPTQYDSPTTFDPAALAPVLQQLDRALANFANRPTQ